MECEGEYDTLRIHWDGTAQRCKKQQHWIEMGERLVVISRSGVVTSTGQFKKLSLLYQQLHMPGSCSSKYNRQLLHLSQVRGGHTQQCMLPIFSVRKMIDPKLYLSC